MRTNREAVMLSPIDVAATLGVSEDTVRRRIRSGEIRCVRIGRRVLIHRDEVALLTERGLPSASPAEVPSAVAAP